MAPERAFSSTIKVQSPSEKSSRSSQITQDRSLYPFSMHLEKL